MMIALNVNMDHRYQTHTNGMNAHHTHTAYLFQLKIRIGMLCRFVSAMTLARDDELGGSVEIDIFPVVI